MDRFRHQISEKVMGNASNCTVERDLAMVLVQSLTTRRCASVCAITALYLSHVMECLRQQRWWHCTASQTWLYLTSECILWKVWHNTTLIGIMIVVERLAIGLYMKDLILSSKMSSWVAKYVRYLHHCNLRSLASESHFKFQYIASFSRPVRYRSSGLVQLQYLNINFSMRVTQITLDLL